MRTSIVAIPAIVGLLLSQMISFAQDKDRGGYKNITSADFRLPATPGIDSNADAVVLLDKGELHFVGNGSGWFSYVYTRHTRIRILNSRALGLATVELNLKGQSEKREAITNLAAVTYTQDGGQVAGTKLDQKDVFRERVDEDYTRVKFTMPGAKEGSIIDYTYTITSEYLNLLPAWDFQWVKYPCLYSEYQIEVPQPLTYVFVRQGGHPFAVDKASIGNGSFKISHDHNRNTAIAESLDNFATTNTFKHDWVLKDVPAFGDEPYLTTPKNYVDRIDFQMSSVHSGVGEEASDHSNSWALATYELLDRDDFGHAILEENGRVDELADKIDSGGGDRLRWAKSIYYYVNHHFVCTGRSKFITTTLQDVIKKGNGTVGDINLLLIAILRRKGFKADPVVLSTRDYGFNLASYPVLQRLNYVIARLNLSGQVYYLDATHPQLGFGQLPGDCYNGHARIISKQDSGSVYFEADSLKENVMTTVLLTGSDKGLEGTWQSVPGPERSYEIRKEVGDHGMPQYFKDIQTRYGEDMEISHGGIDSLDKPEEPLKVHYDFVLKQASPVIYINPMIGAGYKQNPFGATERKYPVELPHTIDELYVFSMEVPPGYVIDEVPKSARVAFNGDQGQFEYLIARQGDQVQLRCRVRLNKAWFPAEDYANLRDFFAFIVKKEAETIVLKKK